MEDFKIFGTKISLYSVMNHIVLVVTSQRSCNNKLLQGQNI